MGSVKSNLRHREVLRRDESKKDCVGDENERKAGQQGSRLWVLCSTLDSAGFWNPCVGQNKSSVSAVGGQVTESCNPRLD